MFWRDPLFDEDPGRGCSTHRPVRYDFPWNLCCDPGLDWALHLAPVRLTLSRHYSGLEKGAFRQAATGNVMEMLIIGPLPQLVELKTPG